MLYTEGLHKVERPKFERRVASNVASFMLRVPDDAIGMMTPDEAYGEAINYGTDISTLARRLEVGSF